MQLPIFYSEILEATDFITLNEDTSKHVIQVLRMKEGEELQLTDGKGNLFTAAVTSAHKKNCTVRVMGKKFEVRSTKEISIAISLLKNANRFEWFLEKATELGVTEIIPLICDRTEKQHFRFERMNNIIIAAMLQSRQVWLPLLHEPIPFEKVISSGDYTTKLIAHCEDEQKGNINDDKNAASAQILIGPEGDFTKDEIGLALSNGYKPVTLGNTRLRTETAGVAAAVLMCVS